LPCITRSPLSEYIEISAFLYDKGSSREIFPCELYIVTGLSGAIPEPIGEVLPKTISNESTLPAPICNVATSAPCRAVIVEFTFTLNGTCAVFCPQALAQNAKRATKAKKSPWNDFFSTAFREPLVEAMQNEERARVAILGVNITNFSEEKQG
jgi:hypothetical protein